jgi:protocatechuate 3,4-dioxygenase beta subunit
MLSRRHLLFAAAAAPCVDLKSRVRIAPEGEPGRAILVSGTVFRPDGKTPAPGVTMYVYQTDITGEYGGTRESGPRLRGWLTTDSGGRYEYRTIRPAPYPGGRIPAHIHVQFWGQDVPPQWADDVLFEDDKLVGAADRERSRALGSFAFVLPVDAHGQVVRNYRLKSDGDRFEDSIMHGRRNCQAG